MFIRHHFLRHVRLVLTWFLLSVVVTGVAPVMAQAAWMDPSICSSTAMDASNPGGTTAAQGHTDCTLCAAMGASLPPQPVRLVVADQRADVLPVAIDRSSPSAARRSAQARGPPAFLNN